MHCTFERIDATDDYRCTRNDCGQVVHGVTVLPIYAPCRSKSVSHELRAIEVSPHAWQKAINFTKAIFKQSPLAIGAAITGNESIAFRSRDEIMAIAEICKACPFFNGDICTHQKCGCPIDDERNAWWSKIAWKSQHCPDKPPRW